MREQLNGDKAVESAIGCESSGKEWKLYANY